MMKMRNGLIVLILIVVMMSGLLSGCIDEALLSEEYLDSFEAEMEILSEEVESYMAALPSHQRPVFESRLDDAFESILDGFFPELDNIEEMLEDMTDEEIQELDSAQFEAIFDELRTEIAMTVQSLMNEFNQSMDVITLVIDQSTAFVNGVSSQLDQAPVIRSGRTMIPLRFIGEALGATILWDESARSVTYTKEGQQIVLVIGEPVAWVNGTQVALDAAPEILNSRTVVPLRFISENLGYSVIWEADDRRVTVYGNDSQ
jgi:hypothetical protein